MKKGIYTTMGTKVTFTPLTKGRANWTGELEVDLFIDSGNEGTRIFPVLEPEDVPVPHLESFPPKSNITHSVQTKSPEGELSLPKTYLTRKGGLLLYTAPDNVELTSEHKNFIRKGLMKHKKNLMKDKFGTLEKFAQSVLEFGNEEIHEDFIKSADSAYCLKFLHGDEDFKTSDLRFRPGGDLSTYLKNLRTRTARAFEHIYPSGVTSVQVTNVQNANDQEETEDAMDLSPPQEVSTPETRWLGVPYASRRTRPVSAPEPVFRRRIGSGRLLPHRKLSAEKLAASLKSSSYLGRPSSSDRISASGAKQGVRDGGYSVTPSTRPNSPSTRPNTPSSRPSSSRSRPNSSMSRSSSAAGNPGNSWPSQNEENEIDSIAVKENVDDVLTDVLPPDSGHVFAENGTDAQISLENRFYTGNFEYNSGPQRPFNDANIGHEGSALLPQFRILSPVESVRSEDLDAANSDYEFELEPVISVEIRSGRSSVASSHSGFPSRPSSALKEIPAPSAHPPEPDLPVDENLKNHIQETVPFNQGALALPINQVNEVSDKPINEVAPPEPKGTGNQTNGTEPIPDLSQNSKINSETPKHSVTQIPNKSVAVDQSIPKNEHKDINYVPSLSTTGSSSDKLTATKEEVQSVKKDNLANQTTKELEKLFGPPKPPKSPPKKGKEIRKSKVRKQSETKQRKKSANAKPSINTDNGDQGETELNRQENETQLSVQKPELRRVSFEVEVLEKKEQEDKQSDKQTKTTPDQNTKDEEHQADEGTNDEKDADIKPGTLTLADLEIEQNLFKGNAKTSVERESEAEEEDGDMSDEDVQEKRQNKKKPAKKEKKVLTEEEIQKIEEEKARQRKEREEAKQRKLQEMLELQQKIKVKEEEMQKQNEQALERKKKLQEDIEKIASEAEMAKQAELAARQKLAAERKAAKEERDAKRKLELERKKAEAAKKRDRERKMSEGARMRERTMLGNISGMSKAEILQLEEKRREEMLWEEEQQRLDEERLIKDANDEEQHLTMLDMLAEEQALSHLVADRKNTEETRRALEEEAERMRDTEEQEREQLLREQQKFQDIQKQKEEEEQMRQEKERKRLKELERQEEERREKLKQQAFQKRQMLLMRRDQNLDRRTHLEGLKEEQGVTRPWVFSYYVPWPMETYEKLMVNEDGTKKPSSGKKGNRGKSGKKGKKGKKKKK